MKQKTLKKVLLTAGIGVFSIILLASCTANFCSAVDQANIMYSYDVGSTVYVKNESEIPTEFKKENLYGKYNDNLWFYQDYQHSYYVNNDDPAHPEIKDSMITLTNKSADSNKIAKPADKFWFMLDDSLLKVSWARSIGKTIEDIKIVEDDLKSNGTVEKVTDCLKQYGYLKFSGDNDALWGYWDLYNNLLKRDESEGGIGIQNCPNSDYVYLYKTAMNQKVNNVRSCICLNTGDFGNFGYDHNKVQITSKDWGYAWSKGFLEGLLVFPVAYMVEFFSHSFGMNGWGQLGAILLVTFIVRLFIALIGFKSTLGQQKMQMLQPELAKLQAKYPNSNTNNVQKQRLAQEQMALYKKHKINPLSSLLILVVQFPLFIGVWGAMQGSAALASDAVLNLHLSDSIWNTLTYTTGLPSNVHGWWTALSLFILMAVSQFISMKLPQWMQKHREKKMPKYNNMPTQQTKQQKQTKWIGYIMLVFIIIMGFTLPAGMGVYWLAGALFSVFQTFVTQCIIAGTFKKWGRAIKGLFNGKKSGVKKDDNTIDFTTKKGEKEKHAEAKKEEVKVENKKDEVVNNKDTNINIDTTEKKEDGSNNIIDLTTDKKDDKGE